jgi:hypothetical protein
MEKITYTPDNGTIFPGFYESELYNSDQEYNFSYNEGEEYEIKDFDGYCKYICEALSDKISDYLTSAKDICKSVKYKAMSSPREYNFTTDHLLMDAEIDLSALKERILADSDYKDGFDNYLRYKYSSRSGFISFVSNNVDDFFKDDFSEYFDVLIDYFLLTMIYDDKDVVKHQKKYEETPYWWDMLEIVSDAECQFMERVNS